MKKVLPLPFPSLSAQMCPPCASTISWHKASPIPIPPKLRVLLPHWVEHNAEHAAEFSQWAERARAGGKAEVADEIELAAKQLGWVNEALRAAQDSLGATD